MGTGAEQVREAGMVRHSRSGVLWDLCLAFLSEAALQARRHGANLLPPRTSRLRRQSIRWSWSARSHRDVALRWLVSDIHSEPARESGVEA